MDHREIIEVLDRTRPFRPRILEIARDLTGTDGAIDQEAAMLQAEEIKDARQEAQNYVQAVSRLREAVSCRI